ncbi:hypothetical protein [Nocardia vaccinii]|uniref:hypothetical protein n=1 Tax=Nocardia vaccinii TaxID=1822 RepID=UPI0012F4EC0D|nr:hypothetical protein [Nocardia vaccinii]
MSVASETVRTLGAAASATVHTAEAAGGAVVGAVTGAARGTVEGAVSGAHGGIDMPTATVLGVIAVGVTGLVDWPIAVAAGGLAGAGYLLRRARTESGEHATVERPKPRKTARPRQATAGQKKSAASQKKPTASQKKPTARQKQSTAGTRRSRPAAR